MIIKNIFDGVFDEETHSAFLKFGRGEYHVKYLTEVKRQKDKWAIKTGAEFANFLVKKCLEDSEESIEVKGIIVSTFDLREEVKFPIEKAKNFMGIRQLVLNTEIKKSEILDLMERYPRAFFALSFKTPKNELKIKAKAPKSSKPSTKEGEEPKADFCSLKTYDDAIVKELVFDFQSFKEIKVKHSINIQEIVYPKNASEMKPEEIRENSKRKGVIVREADVDGEKETKQANFET
jgi:hypothetical protein